MRDFFEALWPEFAVPGSVTFWINPGRISEHIPLQALGTATDDDFAELEQINRQGKAVYYGLGLRENGLPSNRQGGKKNTVALPGFALDIDIYHPKAHVATNLPTNDQQAYSIIANLHDPSIIVHTGYGWHCYWLFREPVLLETEGQRSYLQQCYAAFQQPIIDRAAAVGLHVDKTATIQRVWRVPGFMNWKTASPEPVRVLHMDASMRYEINELSERSALFAYGFPSDVGDDGGDGDGDDDGDDGDGDGDGDDVGDVGDDKNAMDGDVVCTSTAVPVQDSVSTTAAVIASLENLSDGSPNKALIRLVLAGEGFAPPGQRDEALQRVCSTIGWSDPARNMPPHIVAEVLRPSLSMWAAETDSDKTVDEELVKAIDKIARAQQDYRDHQAKQARQLDALARVIRRRGGEDAVGDPFDAIAQHAIIQYKSTFFVFNFGNQSRSPQPVGYSKPLIRDEVLVYARDAWEQAPSLELTYINEKDVEKQKTLLRVMQEYCTKAADVVGDLAASESTFDPDRSVFYEALAPLRITEAVYNADVASWLELLAGDQIDKVLDWIATVTVLNAQSCALYLSGASGSGKGLLAEGLSRLWRVGGPARMEQVLGDFNSEMFRCPLVVLDEGLPKRKGDLSAQIRTLIGSSSFTLNEKYQAPITVHGSIRALITANNESVLALGDEDMSLQDLEAVAGRFLHVHAHTEAAEWLRIANTGRALTAAWIRDDTIAKHALWLRDNRTVIPGKRFLVEGEQTDMHRRLLMQGDNNGLVFEWLARYTTNPIALETIYKGRREEPSAYIGDGEILINTQAVVDCWDSYMKGDFKCPSTGRVGRILTKLSDGYGRARQSRKRLHRVKPELVLGWAIENQVGDEDRMLANISRQNPKETESDGAEKC